MATANSRLRFLYILPTIFCITLACFNDELYFIKSTPNQYLVLDGSDATQIRLQEYTGAPSQLWKFEEGDRVGLFYVINNQTGKVLDYHPADDNYLNLVTKTRKNVLWQQWALRVDGKITSVENKRNIHVYKSNFAPGNRVVTNENYAVPAQDFTIVRFHFVDLLIHPS